MNSLTKFIASISALIASLSFAWIALTITGIVPKHVARVTLYHNAEIGLSHSGDLDITHSGSVELLR